MNHPSLPPFETRLLRSEQRLRRAIRVGNSREQVIRELAAYVYQLDITDGASINQQVIDLFAVAYSMMVVTSQVLGQKAAFGPNGKLGVDGLTLHALISQVALHSRHTRVDLKYVTDMRDGIDMLQEPHAYAYNLLSTLERAIESAVQLREYAESMLSPAESTLDRLGVSLSVFGSSLADVNDEVAAELVAMRRYGVKPAFFRDGMMHGPNEAWVVMPPPTQVNPVLAITSLSPLGDLSNLEYQSRLMPDGSNAYVYPLLAHLVMYVGFDGHLTQGSGYAAISSQEVLRASGQGDWYEVLRLVELMRLYDLIVPLESVATLPVWPQLRAGRLLSGLVKKSTKLSLTPDLLLPRIKLLQHSKLLIEQLEQEVEQADRNTLERATLRRHQVVDHVRKLPAGRSPTPAARQRAREALGIELANNETYVRKHKRGTGEEIRSHRARTRNQR